MTHTLYKKKVSLPNVFSHLSLHLNFVKIMIQGLGKSMGSLYCLFTYLSLN